MRLASHIGEFCAFHLWLSREAFYPLLLESSLLVPSFFLFTLIFPRILLNISQVVLAHSTSNLSPLARKILPSLIGPPGAIYVADLCTAFAIAVATGLIPSDQRNGIASITTF